MKYNLIKYVALAEPLGEPPFGLSYRSFALEFNIIKVCNFRTSIMALRNHSVIRWPLFFIANLVLSFKM